MRRDDSSIRTIELLDAKLVSGRTSPCFAGLLKLFGKRYNDKEDMAQYIDAFQQLVA